jgi:hypothetical protein
MAAKSTRTESAIGIRMTGRQNAHETCVP